MLIEVINSINNIETVEDSVIEIITEDGKVKGVRTDTGEEIICKALDSFFGHISKWFNAYRTDINTSGEGSANSLLSELRNP